MGLIFYRLRLAGDTPPSRVDEILAELYAAARELPVIRSPKVQVGDPRWHTLFDLMLHDPYVDGTALRQSDLSTARGFAVMPGEGTEYALIGFVHRHGRGEEHEWFWDGFCRTQFASRVSEEHFVACHEAFVALLERAEDAGIQVTVNDDSGYWLTRDRDRLLERMREVNSQLKEFEAKVHAWRGTHVC